MLIIEDGAISLTRGDTAYIDLGLTDDSGEAFEVNEGDTATLTVRKTVDSDVAFAVTINLDETNTIYIRPSDTKDLEYGKYYYDIQIDTAAGEVFTVVEKSPFKIKEEITR